jgi:hypothetical protein
MTSTNMGKNVRSMISLVALAGAINLASCGAILEAESQTILMNVTPEDAQCFGWRNDLMVGAYNPLFQSMTVSKSTDELLITCNAYGYKTKRLRLMPSEANWNDSGIDVFDYAASLGRYDGRIVIVMDKSDSAIGQ